MFIKNSLLIALAAAVFIVFASLTRVPQPKPKSAGPPACYAGNPPGSFTCATGGCHDNFALNSGTANLTLDLGGADTGYVPGNTYIITVSIEKQGMVRAGFQSIALLDSNNALSPGIVTLTEPLRTQQVDSVHLHNGACPIVQRVWVEHTYNGTDVVSPGVNTWQYQWQAPATDMGNITFYVASLEANNDGEESGDRAYSTQQTIAAIIPDTTDSTNSISDNELALKFSVFPNPANDILTLETLLSLKTQYTIYDLTGSIKQSGSFLRRKEIDVNELPQGVYLIRIETTQGSFSRKFVRINL